MTRFIFQIFLVIILSVTALYAEPTAPTERLITNVEDFWIHTRNHVDNVEALADELFKLIQSDPVRYRAVFNIPNDVPLNKPLRNQLIEFLEVHDEAKLNTSQPFLEFAGVQRPLIFDLHEQLGVPFPREVINRVNSVDSRVAQRFQRNRNIPQWKMNFFEAVEKIVDPVERYRNIVTPEEMGRKPYSQSGRLARQLDLLRKEGKTSPVELKRLEEKIALTKLMEERYAGVAKDYRSVRKHMLDIKEAMIRAGVNLDNLDDFAVHDLIRQYEKRKGVIRNPNDPKLINQLRNYFFNTNYGEAELMARVLRGRQDEAKAMVHYGRYMLLKEKQKLVSPDRFTEVFESFEKNLQMKCDLR